MECYIPEVVIGSSGSGKIYFSVQNPNSFNRVHYHPYDDGSSSRETYISKYTQISDTLNFRTNGVAVTAFSNDYFTASTFYNSNREVYASIAGSFSRTVVFSTNLQQFWLYWRSDQMGPLMDSSMCTVIIYFFRGIGGKESCNIQEKFTGFTKQQEKNNII